MQANRDLENLKFDIEKKRSKFQLYDENFKKSFQVLGEFIKTIQIFKDFLLTVTKSIKDSLDSELVLDNLRKIRENTFKYYEDNSHYLEKESREAAHTSKNEMLVFENKLIELLKDREYVNLSDPEKGIIEKARIRVTDFQEILRDQRVKALVTDQ